jgi:hypothetical protein
MGSRQVLESIPRVAGVLSVVSDSSTGSTQPLKVSTRLILGVKAASASG